MCYDLSNGSSFQYGEFLNQNEKEEGRLTAPVADWPTKRKWVNQAFERLENVGYKVTSAYTAVKNPENTKFVYRDRLWAGADMIDWSFFVWSFWVEYIIKT